MLRRPRLHSPRQRKSSHPTVQFHRRPWRPHLRRRSTHPRPIARSLKTVRPVRIAEVAISAGAVEADVAAAALAGATIEAGAVEVAAVIAAMAASFRRRNTRRLALTKTNRASLPCRRTTFRLFFPANLSRNTRRSRPRRRRLLLSRKMFQRRKRKSPHRKHRPRFKSCLRQVSLSRLSKHPGRRAPNIVLRVPVLSRFPASRFRSGSTWNRRPRQSRKQLPRQKRPK